MTVSIRNIPASRRDRHADKAAAPPGASSTHIGSRGGLYTIPGRLFHGLSRPIAGPGGGRRTAGLAPFSCYLPRWTAAAMARKSPATRLAPPTSAPSTSSTAKKLLGIGGLHRAAIEDADATPGRAEARRQPLADEAVNLGHVGRRRRQPGADRPDRLIGDDEIADAPSGSEPSSWRADDVAGAAGLALGARLADANNGDQPGPMRRHGLGAHLGIGFVVVVRGARNGRRSPPWRRHRAAFRRRCRRYGRRTARAWQSWPPIADAASRAPPRQSSRSRSPADRPYRSTCRRARARRR